MHTISYMWQGHDFVLQSYMIDSTKGETTQVDEI